VIDGDSPLELATRFTWLPWPKAELLSCSTETDRIQWQGQHFAYNRSPWNIIHSRSVTVENDRWEITDTLKGKDQHILELRWHLPSETEQIYKDGKSLKLRLSKDWVMEVSGQTELTFRQSKARNEGGWESYYYGVKSPICTISAIKDSQLPVEFKTVVYKEDMQCT
jgi:hypothetical protein